MKKFLLPLLALALSATAAAAQDTQASPMGGAGMQEGGQRRSPEEMAAMQTKRLTQELSLTPDQATKVQQIVLSRQQDMQAMRSQAQGGDRSQMREQMQTMRAKYDAQYKAVLTPDQYTKYTAMEQRGGGRGMGQGMGQGGPNQSSDTNTKVKDSDGKVKIKVKPSDN